MNIIAFDTASETCSLGLSVSGKERYYLEIAGGQKHSECLMDGTDALLRLAGLPKTSLERTACMEGPGSFTGLRIGFAAARGISAALDIPLVPVPTLDCMAASFSFWPGIVLPLLDAKKNAFFTALFRRGKRLSPYLDVTIPEIIKALAGVFCSSSAPDASAPLQATKDSAPPQVDNSSGTLLLTGPGAPLALPLLAEAFPETVLDPGHSRGRAVELLNMAGENHILNKRPRTGPFYLRKSDAELSG